MLLRDILSGDDPQIDALRDVILQISPDILLLTAFDYDLNGVALGAFADMLRRAGADYPFRFAILPNFGMATGVDLNGDGRLGTPHDAQGYADFAGQGGMALLSRYPIRTGDVVDFSSLLWSQARMDQNPPAVLRLSSNGHWDVPIELPDGQVLRLLAFHAGTPAFGGPDRRNIRRNRDQVLFWVNYLDKTYPENAPDVRFVVLGDANLDPADGLGDRTAIRALLDHPLLQDPGPTSVGAKQASLVQGGINHTQTGDPALDTADWQDGPGRPGNLRVDYVLPSRDMQVLDTGVFWPQSDPALGSIPDDARHLASRHALVWVDLLW